MGYNPLFSTAIGFGSSRQTKTAYQNGTGFTAPISTVVAQGTGVNFVLVDVSSESTVSKFLGMTAESIPNSATGQIASEGRLESIPLSLGFSIGDPVWVGTTPGMLTNVQPDLAAPGWSVGMFVIFIGVVVQNQFDPLKQDVQIFKQLIGQL